MLLKKSLWYYYSLSQKFRSNRKRPLLNNKKIKRKRIICLLDLAKCLNKSYENE